MLMAICLCVFATSPGIWAEDLTELVRQIEPNVVDVVGRPDDERKAIHHSLIDDVYGRLRKVNRQDVAAWREVSSRQDWERLRDERLEGLRRSVGPFPELLQRVDIQVTRRIDGDGYCIDNIIYQSRPDLWVTGNLYRPAADGARMPGILICPSHHNPKTQGELQDMGMTWARQGCYVLVIDNLGHGERRQHPFRTREDYTGEFAVGRQDYHFRYNVGLQLHLAGESLIGWLVWDLMRGVDVLLAQPQIDPQKIILLGSVAGGGDPAAVAAALDPRIACVAPFNFGGPQPETRHPLPEDAELSFNYTGGGSWESTRNLRLSARDGFLPWVIVGAVAPRRLIYAHEFSWDQEHDPVWRRLNTIYGYYDQAGQLDYTHGFGQLSGQPPQASHCNNIGPPHRQRIHQALARWFDIPVPAAEAHDRRDAKDLLCLEGTEATEATDIRLTPVHELAMRIVNQRADAVRKELAQAGPAERRAYLRKRWSEILGSCEPWEAADVDESNGVQAGPVNIERFVLRVDRDIRIPAILLSRANAESPPRAVVVGVAQEGKAGFLQERSPAIAALLESNLAVCLVDLRGTGECSVGDSRGRRSDATGVSSSALMLGTPQIGEQLRDLRTLLAYLRTRRSGAAQLPGEGAPLPIGLWGDSFAPTNATADDKLLYVPLDLSQPHHSEPGGPLLSLLAALFEENISAVAAPRGGLVSFRSLLESQFCHVPHDLIVPGACSTGDLPELAAALNPCRMLLTGMVDGLNRPASDDACQRAYALALSATEPSPHPAATKRTVIGTGDYTSETGQKSLADWLVAALSQK